MAFPDFMTTNEYYSTDRAAATYLTRVDHTEYCSTDRARIKSTEPTR